MNMNLTRLATMMLVAAAMCSPSHADLVAHWTGNNTAVDGSGNGHDGTVNGATYVPGQFGSAFSFDGVNDSVIVGADPDLEPSSISISMWVQAVSENHLRILADSTHGAGSAGWALQLNGNNNVSFAYGNGTGFPEVIGATDIADGQFHHVVATLDGSDMRLFVDGVQDGMLGYTGPALASGRDIQLGRHLSLSGREFNGLLDDVQLYNHALSQSQITNLANGLAIPEPGSVALLGLASLALVGYRRRV